MDASTTQQQRQTLYAVVYPVCECGCSYPDHLDTAPESAISCAAGYRPTRPIEDLGCISAKTISVEVG